MSDEVDDLISCGDAALVMVERWGPIFIEDLIRAAFALGIAHPSAPHDPLDDVGEIERAEDFLLRFSPLGPFIRESMVPDGL